MLRALWLMVRLGAIAAAAAWLAMQRGAVTIEWRDYTVSLQAGFFLASLLVVILFSIFVYAVLRGISRIPKVWSRYRKEIRRERGYRALTQGLSAIAAGDEKAAAQHSRKALAYLPQDKGLPILLQAQVARMQGHHEEAQRGFAELLDNRDTAFLGARGLLLEAMERGDEVSTQKILDKALKLQPRQPWLIKLAYGRALKAQRWGDARALLKRLEKAGGIDFSAVRSDRAAIFIAEADEKLLQGFRGEARSLLQAALKLRPHFVPAIKRLAGLQMYVGRRRSAQKMVEAAWRVQDHPDLPRLWEAVMPPHKVADTGARMRWMERLLQINPNNAAGYAAVARLAAEQKMWGEARMHLQKAIALNPDADLYGRLADLEERIGVGSAAARWRDLAQQASPPMCWVCAQTGKSYADWTAFAPPHGAFNTMAWAMPVSEDIRDARALARTRAEDTLLEAPA